MKWAVLVGGRGSNLQALLDHGLEVALVVSHREGVGALAVATAHRVRSATLLPSRFPSRLEYGRALRQALDAAEVDAIAMAGFMRWLDAETVEAWAGRVFNIHPSLLPAFSGINAVAQALAHGVQWTGVTVHLVDQGQDSGPIVAQVPVPVMRGDTELRLAQRIHEAEHQLYGRVLKAYEDRNFELVGQRVIWRIEPPQIEGGTHAVGIDQRYR